MSDCPEETGRGRRRQAGRLVRACGLVGVDPAAMLHAARGAPRFVRDWRAYSRLSRCPGETRFPLAPRLCYPVLGDWYAQAGTASGHYFHQDLWAARKIHDRRPTGHVDVGSAIGGFVAHLLSFMPVTVVDVRPLESYVDGLTFVRDDGSTLEKFDDRSVGSLSSLHAVEHFGLGRYGDPVDPSACFRGMEALMRVLSPGGHLYFSVPVGRERLHFNAHRVFAPDTILAAFSEIELLSFAAVDDAGVFREGLEPRDAGHLHFGCGLFEFQRRPAAAR